MKKRNKILVTIGILFIFIGCDGKDMAEYVARRAYNKLQNKYDKLQNKYDKLETENIKLKNELAQYKKGFKSMYE